MFILPRSEYQCSSFWILVVLINQWFRVIIPSPKKRAKESNFRLRFEDVENLYCVRVILPICTTCTVQERYLLKIAGNFRLAKNRNDNLQYSSGLILVTYVAVNSIILKTACFCLAVADYFRYNYPEWLEERTFRWSFRCVRQNGLI